MHVLCAAVHLCLMHVMVENSRLPAAMMGFPALHKLPIMAAEQRRGQAERELTSARCQLLRSCTLRQGLGRRTQRL